MSASRATSAGGLPPLLLARAALLGWPCFVSGAVLLLARSVENGDLTAAPFLGLVAGASLVLWAWPGSRRGSRRTLIGLFLLALGLRLAATALFDVLGTTAGDPFAGSSDAWAYDQWARRLVRSWSQLRWVPLERWDQAGRWDVGFHYVLAAVYALFGPSLLLGRALVAFFGALAVVFFAQVATRVVKPGSAQLASLAYAVWPTSVAWNGYSLLRDSLVWALIFLAILLVLLVLEGESWAAPALAATLISLRMTRPYAFGVVAIGLLIAAGLAVLRRARFPVVPALQIAGALLVVETAFFALGFPSVPGIARSYLPGDVILRNVDRSPAASTQALIYPRDLPSRTAEEPDTLPEPKHLFGSSIPANAARFLINPPAWAPVRGDIRKSDNWQLPGMWAWYLILPLAGIGLVLGVARSGALRVLFLATLCFAGLLILAGRGDFARQREMVVPLLLLAAAIGWQFALLHRRAVLVVYLAYALVFAIGVAYHRHTLRERGMIGRAPGQTVPSSSLRGGES